LRKHRFNPLNKRITLEQYAAAQVVKAQDETFSHLKKSENEAQKEWEKHQGKAKVAPSSMIPWTKKVTHDGQSIRMLKQLG
jgi:hypothetical protein